MSTVTPVRGRGVARIVVAGPLALIAAVLAMAATPLWAPSSQGGVNHFALPVILFPAYWAATCLYAVIDGRLLRAGGVLLASVVANGFLIFNAVTG